MTDKAKKAKGFKAKKAVRTEKKAEGQYTEVLVYDVVNHERVVAEHRGESKWWFGTRLYKVYHPGFKELEDGGRWVTKLGKTLGNFDPAKEYPTPQMVRAEQNTVARMMVDYRE